MISSVSRDPGCACVDQGLPNSLALSSRVKIWCLERVHEVVQARTNLKQGLMHSTPEIAVGSEKGHRCVRDQLVQRLKPPDQDLGVTRSFGSV